MKYSIHIDQVHAIKWGLNLSEAACFSFCYALPSWAETVITDGEVYYFASRTKVIAELPILTDKTDTIYRLYKALDEKGLIKYRRFSGKDCVQITEKGKEWNSEKNPSKEMNSENFPSDHGKFSELSVENFPTYNNTSIDNNTIDTNSLSKKQNAPEILQPISPTPEPDAIFAAALKNATDYIKADNGVFQLIRDASRVSESEMSDRQVLEEMTEWVRWNSSDLGFPKEAAHRLLYGRSTFVAWMRKAKEIIQKKKPVANGTNNNRNTETAADRERRRAAGAFAVRDEILRSHGIDPSQYGGDY